MATINDWDLQSQEIDQRRKYAEMLRAQSLQPMEANQVVGGRVVPVSWTQGLAKMLQAYSGAAGVNKANEDQRGLAEKLRQTTADDMGKVMGAMYGQPEQQVPNFVNAPDASGAIPTATQPAVAGDRAKAMSLALASASPAVQGIGAKIMEQEMKVPEGININGQLVNKYTGQPMGSRIAKEPEPFSLSPGQIRYGADGKPIAEVKDMNRPFNADGTPNAAFQNFEIAKHRAGASNTQVSVNTATKPMLNELGKGVGEKVISDFNGAQSAAQTLQNAQQIRDALKKGVIVGPGASARIKLEQIGQVIGVGGKDSAERLANTRAAMQGLARQELAAAGSMKGQGQITQSEREILRKAESGELSEMTTPELNTLLGALEKTANYRISLHNSNLERLKKDPNAAGVVDYMNIAPSAPKNIAVDF